MGDAIPVGHQLERAELGLDVALVDTLDSVLGFQAMADQGFDRADLEIVLCGEGFQLRAAGHRAVGIEDFHQHAGRLQAGETA